LIRSRANEQALSSTKGGGNISADLVLAIIRGKASDDKIALLSRSVPWFAFVVSAFGFVGPFAAKSPHARFKTRICAHRLVQLLRQSVSQTRRSPAVRML
jgi:hypothetical protein